MPYAKRRMPRLPLVALALLCSACAGKPSIQVRLLQPPVADLRVEPKPVMPDAALTSEVAAAVYDAELEAFGDRGWAAVGRICRWVAANGGVCPE